MVNLHFTRSSLKVVALEAPTPWLGTPEDAEAVEPTEGAVARLHKPRHRGRVCPSPRSSPAKPLRSIETGKTAGSALRLATMEPVVVARAPWAKTAHRAIVATAATVSTSIYQVQAPARTTPAAVAVARTWEHALVATEVWAGAVNTALLGQPMTGRAVSLAPVVEEVVVRASQRTNSSTVATAAAAAAVL